MKKFKLLHQRAPGDVLMLTALVRDIARAYPGQYGIDVLTSYGEIWQNNPYLLRSTPENAKEYHPLTMDYGKHMPHHVTKAKGTHFVGAFHQEFKFKTGIVVPLTEPRGDLHLTPADALPMALPSRYWVILAGGKTDFITKHWSYTGYQSVADVLQGMGIPVVQAGGTSQSGKVKDLHMPLHGVVNLLGKTTLRQFMQVLANADGVICTITFAMHAAAALGKPCVVIAGGREEPWWEAYHRDNPNLGVSASKLPVNHRDLHTVGQLVCRPEWAARGCWKSYATPAQARAAESTSYCLRPVSTPGQVLPECMSKISTERVLESVLSYYYDGTLPPIPGSAVTGLATTNSPVIIELPNKQQAIVRLELLTPAGGSPGAVSLPVVAESPPAPVKELPKPPPPVLAAAPVPTAVTYPSLDVTSFSLLYGEYYDMHARHLKGLIDTVNQSVKIRVFCNQVGRTTKALVDRYVAEGKIEVAYHEPVNINKYPAMRKMFNDPAHPITTPWIMWFDDDTMVDVDRSWFAKVCQVTLDVTSGNPMVAMIGIDPRFYTLTPALAVWIRNATWYKKRPFRDTAGKPGPGCDKTHFLAGSFWLMKTSVMQELGIPDVRLNHNGGDVAIGEMLYQGGYSTYPWLKQKGTILWSAQKRRGFAEGAFGIGTPDTPSTSP